MDVNNRCSKRKRAPDKGGLRHPQEDVNPCRRRERAKRKFHGC
jgi:hypothetical protein